MITPDATVNGRTVAFGNLPTHTSALDWIRDLGFTGAKEGCAEGSGGVRDPGRDRAPPATTRRSGSASMPASSRGESRGARRAHRRGLGFPDDLHPVQREMALRGGSQCGYCTPGFVCSMAAEYYRAGRAADAHPGAPDEPEHGANGFDLHAMMATSAAVRGTGRSGMLPTPWASLLPTIRSRSATSRLHPFRQPPESPITARSMYGPPT